MTDFVAAIGLVLVIEGLLWALAPRLAARMLETIASVPESHVRQTALMTIAAGVFTVWLVRG
jgi:uncharacterized protein